MQANTLQSEYFERACDSTFVEGTTNIIDLSEEPLPVVQAMMMFLYGGEPKYSDDDLDTLCQLNFWVDLYTLADRTMIKKLVTQAAEEFHRQAMTCWTSEAFLDVCREIYSRLPARTVTLRGKVCAIIVEKLGALSKMVEFVDLLQDIPALAIEIALAIGKSLITVRCTAATCSRLEKPVGANHKCSQTVMYALLPSNRGSGTTASIVDTA
jgi:hypothetical protein